MLWWVLAFFVLAIIAAFFGYGNIAEGAMSIARVLFFIFLILFLITLFLALFGGWPWTSVQKT